MIPTPKSDITYKTFEEMRRMPNQLRLDIGWTVDKNGTWLVSVNDGIRCQHWSESDVQETIGRAIDASNFFKLTKELIPNVMRSDLLEETYLVLIGLDITPTGSVDYGELLLHVIAAAFTAGISPRMLVEMASRKIGDLCKKT